MPPTVPLGEIYNFLGSSEPTDQRDAQVPGMGCPDEGLGDLVEDVAMLSGENIHLDDAESLVASINFLVTEMLAAGVPS